MCCRPAHLCSHLQPLVWVFKCLGVGPAGVVHVSIGGVEPTPPPMGGRQLQVTTVGEHLAHHSRDLITTLSYTTHLYRVSIYTKIIEREVSDLTLVRKVTMCSWWYLHSSSSSCSLFSLWSSSLSSLAYTSGWVSARLSNLSTVIAAYWLSVLPRSDTSCNVTYKAVQKGLSKCLKHLLERCSHESCCL